MIQKNAAFTLIEILFVMVVLLVVISIGIPFWTHFKMKNQVEQRLNFLSQVVISSRNLALNKQQNLILSPLTGKDWSSGLSLKGESSPSVNIKEWRFKDDLLAIKWQGFQSKNSLLFSHHLSENTLSGHFKVYPKKHPKLEKKLTVNRFGNTTNE